MDALVLYTRETVEERLKVAFAALRSRPCWTVGPRLVEGHAPDEALALNWLPDFVPDTMDRSRLLLWVRCQISGESWRALCREAGWKMDTENKRRARTLGRIMDGLNARLRDDALVRMHAERRGNSGLTSQKLPLDA